jgi:hypothetical protein
MPDRYVNKTRPSLPAECKVSEQAETLMRVCERVILAHGGERIEVDGQPGYRVRLQPPRLISSLESARLPAVFWNRLFGTTGPVEIDFGDDSELVRIGQEITHAYGKAGLYTAALRSRGPADESVEVRLRVVIDP